MLTAVLIVLMVVLAVAYLARRHARLRREESDHN
jgi:hypothetical protein